MAPEREIVTSARIAAPPQRVWAVLSDGAAYPQWNPFITRFDGVLAPGRRVTMTLTPRTGQAMEISPQLVRVRPGRELRWRGELILPGVFDGEHYFILAPTDAGGTRLTHGERFSGMLPWLIGVERFRGDFEALNRALARRAENSEASPLPRSIP
ncbi:SRPBCC domain-containing protein [Altererythrobacter xixiisoli]|uniref:SRPBCC domain-containing protein n=2 Tax=Croceibacterium xixiisoli TaxID=1476466 RepID=A0A6I4U1W4_9SPHN|nr:SRPBCC domain-containing protein [Croceibacterium xixiisoli]